MKKFALAILLLAATQLLAQPSNPSIRYVSSAPSGACGYAPPIQILRSTGAIYTCNNGTWAAIGGGGSGSVTSVGLSLPADLTVSGSPVTTSGTLTGVWATTPTGTGAMVRATSPTLVSPALGTPTALVLTNATALPAAQVSSGALANGMTGTTQSAADNSTKLATTAYVDAHFIASGTSAMGTSAISSGACATVVTTAATGTATTDVINYNPNADPTGVTGYAVSASGSLYIWAYPTTNNVNFKVCNNTSGSLTPGALTLNWKVTR